MPSDALHRALKHSGADGLGGAPQPRSLWGLTVPRLNWEQDGLGFQVLVQRLAQSRAVFRFFWGLEGDEMGSRSYVCPARICMDLE